MSLLTFPFQASLALIAKAQFSFLSQPFSGVNHLFEIFSDTGYVSESVFPSPPPVGPTCGIKFGEMNFSANRLHKVSNSSCF